MSPSLPVTSLSAPGSGLVSSALSDAYTDIRGLKNQPTEGDQALRRVASQFESMFLDLWLKSMRESGAVFAEGNYFSSPAVETHQQMLDHQWAVHMGNAGGVGIGDALVRQLSSDGANADSAVAPGLVRPARGEQSQARVRHAPQPDQPRSFGGRMPGFQDAAQFVDELLPVIRERLSTTTLNPVAVLAQAALETGWGQKVIHDAKGSPSFNLFGIKAAGWDGATVTVSSVEQEFGRMVPRASEFRVYTDWEASVADYLDFLGNDERYAAVMNAGDDVRAFAQSLQSAGYATDSRYADKVLGVVRKLQESISAHVGGAARGGVGD